MHRSDDDGAPVMSFEKEVEDIVRRGVEEAVNPDNISMEVENTFYRDHIL